MRYVTPLKLYKNTSLSNAPLQPAKANEVDTLAVEFASFVGTIGPTRDQFEINFLKSLSECLYSYNLYPGFCIMYNTLQARGFVGPRDGTLGSSLVRELCGMNTESMTKRRLSGRVA
jgi:hypothetical protein